jgi:hypothetical protein
MCPNVEELTFEARHFRFELKQNGPVRVPCKPFAFHRWSKIVASIAFIMQMLEQNVGTLRIGSQSELG